MKQQHEFTAVKSLTLENSFGVLNKQKDVELIVTVGIKDENCGWFEFYDKESEGNDWYAEGGLIFENKELIDYDGVFSLPEFILDKLDEIGYNTKEMR
jgi:hypothetical protein